MTEQSTTIKKLLYKLILRAGNILRRNLYKSREIIYKAPNDIVTEMDKAVEKIFIQNISRFFPEHDILSEEQASSQASIKPSSKVQYRWIIDPLDGTLNYAHQVPYFSVSVGIEKAGKMFLGAVYNPILKELFFAQQGKGAWCNNKPIKVSTEKHLSESLLATGFPCNPNQVKQNNFKNFEEISSQAQAVRRAGSAALDLCNVACGRFDGFWNLQLKPWDVAAGYLIIKEAGGRVTCLDNTRMSIYKGAYIASNGHIHKAIQKCLA